MSPRRVSTSAEKVLYRKVETFFWGGVVGDLLIAERAESHG
jgi:hypothetical protein